jgi:hypothetical protein
LFCFHRAVADHPLQSHFFSVLDGFHQSDRVQEAEQEMREPVQINQIQADVQRYSQLAYASVLRRVHIPEIDESVQNVILHFPENHVIVEHHSDPQENCQVVKLKDYFRVACAMMVIESKYSKIGD